MKGVWVFSCWLAKRNTLKMSLCPLWNWAALPHSALNWSIDQMDPFIFCFASHWCISTPHAQKLTNMHISGESQMKDSVYYERFSYWSGTVTCFIKAEFCHTFPWSLFLSSEISERSHRNSFPAFPQEVLPTPLVRAAFHHLCWNSWAENPVFPELSACGR